MQAFHTLILTAAMTPGTAPDASLADEGIAAMWNGFEALAPVTHQPLFEASLAVGAFVTWIAFFESIHLWLPRAETWRFDGQLPARPLAGFVSEAHKTLVPAVTYIGSIWLGQQVRRGLAPVAPPTRLSALLPAAPAPEALGPADASLPPLPRRRLTPPRRPSPSLAPSLPSLQRLGSSSSSTVRSQPSTRRRRSCALPRR